MDDYRIDVLRDVPGLTFVPASHLAELAKEFDVVRYDDKLICEERGASEHLYVLADGKAEVLKDSGEGKRYRVATLMPGVLFGHVGVLTVRPRSASVRAVGKVKVLQMTARRAREILRDADFNVASPFRRALIVALSRQLFSATSTTMKLAVDAGMSVDAAPGEARPPKAGRLPDDSLEQLVAVKDGQV